MEKMRLDKFLSNAKVLSRKECAKAIKNREKDIYIVLSEHADNALIFIFRMPVNTTNYWDARFEVLEQVKKAFDEEGISIPYPQLDVHLDK